MRGAIAPLLLFVVSTAVAVCSYLRIVDMERPRVVLRREYVRLGRYSLALMHDEICVGSIGVHIERQENTIVEALLSLRAVYGKVLTKTDLSLNAMFNPLGQFLQGSVRLDGPGVSVSSDAQHASPIDVTIQGTLAGNHIDVHHQFPGPIVLALQADDRFSLTAPATSSIAAPISEQVLHRLFGGLTLRAEELTESLQANCADEAHRLNIAPWLQRLNAEPFSFGGSP